MLLISLSCHFQHLRKIFHTVIFNERNILSKFGMLIKLTIVLYLRACALLTQLKPMHELFNFLNRKLEGE